MCDLCVSVLLLVGMVSGLGSSDQSCPEVKVLGIGDSDKLSILRGCPGHPGLPGQKGDVGAPGEKGQRGSVGSMGKVGPSGRKGQADPTRESEDPPGSHRGTCGAPQIIFRCPLDGDTVKCCGTLWERCLPVGEKGERGETEPVYAARNCKEILDQGAVLSDWYTVYPDGSRPLKVLCDMDTDGGGWIVIQRRWDGSVDFFRTWAAYKKGFGSRLSEFWLGNDNIHQITSTGTWQLRVDLQDFEGKTVFAKYASFKVLDESEKYKILLGDYREGTAGDSMGGLNNMKFSTKDEDNDVYEGSCSSLYKGGWWYGSCHWSNLNGLYLLGEHASFADGINWYTARGHNYSYKHAEMKIRPV